jgi:hypothetical protein
MEATGLRDLVGQNAVVPSFILEGSDFVERVLALRLKLLQLFFPVADSIPAVVQRLVERLAIKARPAIRQSFYREAVSAPAALRSDRDTTSRLSCFLVLPAPWKWNSNSAERGPMHRSAGCVIRRHCRSSRLFSAAAVAAIAPVRAFELAQKWFAREWRRLRRVRTVASQMQRTRIVMGMPRSWLPRGRETSKY